MGNQCNIFACFTTDKYYYVCFKFANKYIIVLYNLPIHSVVLVIVISTLLPCTRSFNILHLL